MQRTCRCCALGIRTGGNVIPPVLWGDSDSEEDEEDFDLETLVAIQRSLEAPGGRQLRREKRTAGSSTSEIAGTEVIDFEEMTESELRYHQYATLHSAWKCANGNKSVPAIVCERLQSEARKWAEAHIASRARHTRQRIAKAE